MTLLKPDLKENNKDFLISGPLKRAGGSLPVRRRFASLFAGAILFLSLTLPCSAETGTASWYSVESCKREGTSGIMANGEVLDDTRFTCASLDFNFGDILMVQNLKNNRKVYVEVTDRGPNHKLYSQGRILDLSKAAFAQIADLKQGLIQVEVRLSNKPR